MFFSKTQNEINVVCLSYLSDFYILPTDTSSVNIKKQENMLKITLDWKCNTKSVNDRTFYVKINLLNLKNAKKKEP